jgi:TIR domain
MIEDLLRHEIALLEPTIDGVHLVFPSQLTREHPDLPDPEAKEVVFSFEGPVQNVYATLAVRISHSGMFEKKEMWKNGATYTCNAGGVCGIYLREVKEGAGELALFFDAVASEETRFQFEEFIHAHLKRRALSDTIRRRRVVTCPSCGTPVTEMQITRRKERGFDWIECNVCDDRIPIADRAPRKTTVGMSKVQEMGHNADSQRDRSTAVSILQGKIATNDFDVFLCHNSADKPAVKELGDQLRARGLLPWLDVEQLPPGLPWQTALENQIKKIKAVAVFVGKQGIGPWQDLEQAAFLRQFVKRKCPVIPVILPNARKAPKLPTFLESMTWVDFRMTEYDPFKLLIWGITGKQDNISKR